MDPPSGGVQHVGSWTCGLGAEGQGLDWKYGTVGQEPTRVTEISLSLSLLICKGKITIR